LAGISLIDRESWPDVEAWVSGATPFLRAPLSDHLEDFRTVCAAPRWSQPFLVATGRDRWSGRPPQNNIAEAAARTGAANKQLIEEARVKILGFLDGLIEVSRAEVAGKGSTSTETTMLSSQRIFISHAGADAEIARRLIHLIKAGLEAPTGSVRCTSVDGYALDGGDDAAEVLRENLRVCSVVLGVLTEASISSCYVLMELGAAWAFKKRAIPLIGPGISFSDIPGPFKDIHALKKDDDAGMSSLIATLARETHLLETNNMPKIIPSLQALRASLGAATPDSADRNR